MLSYGSGEEEEGGEEEGEEGGSGGEHQRVRAFPHDLRVVADEEEPSGEQNRSDAQGTSNLKRREGRE